jgi:hypothetical protein
MGVVSESEHEVSVIVKGMDVVVGMRDRLLPTCPVERSKCELSTAAMADSDSRIQKIYA